MPNGYSDSKQYDAPNLEDEFLCEYVDGTMDPLVRNAFEEYVRVNPGMEEHIECLRRTRRLLCRYACRCRAPSDLHDRLRNCIPGDSIPGDSIPGDTVLPRHSLTCRVRRRGKGDHSVVLRRDGGINAGACSGSIGSAIRYRIRSNGFFRHDGIPRTGCPVPPLYRRSDASILVRVCDSPPAPFSAPPPCPSVAPRTIDRNRRHRARTSDPGDARRLHGCRGCISLLDSGFGTGCPSLRATQYSVIGPLAQGFRALASHARGHWFKSSRAHHTSS